MKSLNHSLFLSVVFGLGSVLGFGSLAFAQVDVEPNNGCAEAQDLGDITLPFVLDGSLNGIDELAGVSRSVDSSSDDAEESPTGSVFLTSSDLELGYEGGGNQTVGMRFSDLDIPPGASIYDAYVSFTVDEVSTDPVALNIVGEAADDAATFSADDFDISSRATTEESIRWTPAPWPMVGAFNQRTPNIARVIREIVDQAGWARGNALAIIITGTGNRQRVAESFDSKSPVGSVAPRLFVRYTVSVGPTPTDNTPDIDFFRFTGEPGAVVRADLLADDNADPVEFKDPRMGLFDSACDLLESHNSPDSDFPIARLQFEIPDDGAFVLAATVLRDETFAGDAISELPYQLVVAPPPPAIGSISGRLIDAERGVPLAGDARSEAVVELDLCGPDSRPGDDCYWPFRSQPPDSAGRFRFDQDGELPLDVGTYQVAASVAGFDRAQSEPFAVGENEDVDVGDLPLHRTPALLSEIEHCDNLPSEGGSCDFSVTITNNYQSTVLRGMAWGVVSASDLGAAAENTRGQIGSQGFNLAPGASTVVRFEFNVPGTVRDGAGICADVLVGEEPEPFFGTVARRFFCIDKGIPPIPPEN